MREEGGMQVGWTKVEHEGDGRRQYANGREGDTGVGRKKAIHERDGRRCSKGWPDGGGTLDARFGYIGERIPPNELSLTLTEIIPPVDSAKPWPEIWQTDRLTDALRVRHPPIPNPGTQWADPGPSQAPHWCREPP